MSWISVDAFSRNSDPVMTSTGTVESAADRSATRVPVTITSSISLLSAKVCKGIARVNGSANATRAALDLLRLVFKSKSSFCLKSGVAARKVQQLLAQQSPQTFRGEESKIFLQN